MRLISVLFLLLAGFLGTFFIDIGVQAGGCGGILMTGGCQAPTYVDQCICTKDASICGAASACCAIGGICGSCTGTNPACPF